MNKPIQDLRDEHNGILLMLKILGKIAEKMRKGEAVDRGHLQKINEFLSNFADRCHHGKEEGILFPEMVKNESNRKAVTELMGEHKTGRDYIRGIVESTATYEADNPDAIHIAINAEGYIRLLREHIEKENEEFFPVAEREISEIRQGEMAEKFETLEREVIGEGKHEEYHGWLKELSGFYLTSA